MKRIAFAALALASSAAHADTVTIPLLDIVAGPITDVGQSFTGNGFIGFDTGPGFHGYEHFFALNGAEDQSKIQVDVSSFSGKWINSATLSFDLAFVQSIPDNVYRVYGEVGDGHLSYDHDLTDNSFGFVTGKAALGSNTIDVTSLLRYASANDVSWLDLNPTSASYIGWYQAYSLYRDYASVRLSIDYSDTPPPAVPEPTSWALLVSGFALVGGTMRARRKSGVFA